MGLATSYSHTLLTLVLLHIVAAMSPGPSVILVAHAAACDSRKSGLAAALAMGVGAGVWAAAALFGLDTFFSNNSQVFHVFQILGALFLIWTGIKMCWGAQKPVSSPLVASSDRIFIRALKLQLLNPKVVIFFGSIFLAALPFGAPLWFKALILVFIFVDETLWYSLVALGLATESAQKNFSDWKAIISLVCGVLLSVLGLKIFFGIV